MATGRERLLAALTKRHGETKGKEIYNKMTARWKK